MGECKVFTYKSNKLLDAVATSAIVYPNTEYWKDNVLPLECRALWDTGARNTCVDQKVIETLHLEHYDIVDMTTASGDKKARVFCVDMQLRGFNPPLVFKNLICVEAWLGDRADVLIGMDIIKQGDFALTHGDGVTTLSFRTPSKCVIDFENEI